MNHESQIGLVEPHAKSTRRDKCFHLVVAQSLLEGCPFLGVRASGVGAYLVPGLDQCSRDVLRRGDRQAVDDPGPRQLTHVLHEPGQTIGWPGQVEHTETQRRPGQRPAQHEHVVTVVAWCDLFGDVLDDSRIGGGRRRQHRDVVGQCRDEITNASVVGSEVVAPVGDAVSLVDDEHSQSPHQIRQLLTGELRIDESFRRYEQNVDLVSVETTGDVSPLRDIGRGDRGGSHTCALRCSHLVAHEGDERGDDEGRSEVGSSLQQSSDEVDRRLSPSGALHHQCTSAVGHQGLDRLPLAGVELGIIATDETAQDCQSAAVQVTVRCFRHWCHGPSPRRSSWLWTPTVSGRGSGTPGEQRNQNGNGSWSMTS